MLHIGDYKFPCITAVLAFLWLKTCNKMGDKTACVGVKVCKSKRKYVVQAEILMYYKW